jgi:hypothetical protein
VSNNRKREFKLEAVTITELKNTLINEKTLQGLPLNEPIIDFIIELVKTDKS